MQEIASRHQPKLKYLGVCGYAETFTAMREFTLQRDEYSADEFWVLEHEPVYTLGQAGRPEHILNSGKIPVIQSDRGGQVTYHGPGQLVLYTLLDIKRLGIGVRSTVSVLEASVIELLGDFGISGHRIDRAPGVYVDGAKISALGLRIRSGRTYHGIALNVNMDLSPFSGINPCGYSDLQVTQLTEYGVDTQPADVAQPLIGHLCRLLGLDYDFESTTSNRCTGQT